MKLSLLTVATLVSGITAVPLQEKRQIDPLNIGDLLNKTGIDIPDKGDIQKSIEDVLTNLPQGIQNSGQSSRRDVEARQSTDDIEKLLNPLGLPIPGLSSSSSASKRDVEARQSDEISKLLNPFNLTIPSLPGASKRDVETRDGLANDIQQKFQDLLPLPSNYLAARQTQSSNGITDFLSQLGLPLPGDNGDFSDVIKKYAEKLGGISLPSKRDNVDSLNNIFLDGLRKFGLLPKSNSSSDLQKSIQDFIQKLADGASGNNDNGNSKRDDQLVNGIANLLQKSGFDLPDNGQLLKLVDGFIDKLVALRSNASDEFGKDTNCEF